MPRAYIALGSNLCEPITQVKKAFSALEKLPLTIVTKQSSLYQSEPFGYDNQPDFINAVAEVNTNLKPRALLKALLKIEKSFGRERPFPNAPRILDLDLLYYDDTTLKTRYLTLPHPRMHQRSFVLLPLAEIAPQLIINAGDVIPKRSNVVKLAQSFQNQNIVKLINPHPA